MTKAEVKELEQTIAQYSNDDYIVSAETGMIENNDKMKSVIRTVVWHKPSKKFVVTMYRDGFSGYKRWLEENMEEFRSGIQRQIVDEREKKAKGRFDL